MSRFIICRASAGSGKTYTLVRQFIEIAISSGYDDQLAQRFSQILAITFTNKAANGMKERIMARLGEIVHNNPKAQALINEMASHLNVSADEVRRRCSVLQSAILHNYSDFSVCTIDSFVHRLVRTFAHDLNLPMNFNVQIDQQEIIQSIVDEMLSLAGSAEEQALTQLLCAFSQSQMDDGKGYKVERSIAKLSKEIFKEEAPQFLPQLEQIKLPQFITIHDRLLADIRDYEKKISSAAAAFLRACADNGLEADDFPNKGTVYNFFQAIEQGDFDKINKTHKRVDDAYKEQKLHIKSTPQSLLPAFQAVLPAFCNAYDAIEDGLRRYNTNRLLISNLYGLAVLGKLNTIKNRYYNDNEIVHISEFNKRLDQEIANEPAPFIYERIGSRYHNYLIDEFQDTSKLQWLNFLPLMDEAMTYDFGDATPEVGTQSLVVGDAKQAIYRFRQGDVRQFVQLPEVDSPRHGHSLRRQARIDHLAINRRTLSNIVNFNNRFFDSIAEATDNELLRQLYVGQGFVGPDGASRPELFQYTVGEGGFVQVSFHPKDELLDSLYNAVRHQVDDLNYRYGDIMVLARDNETLVRISNHFSAAPNPVPIVSSESFVLANSNAVLLLQSALEYIYDPRNRNAALQVAHLAARCGCLEPQIDPSQAYSSELYWSLCDDSFDLAAFLRKFDILFNIDLLRALSLYDTCEQLVRIFRLQGKDSAYVASFLNVVSSYTQHVHSDLASFITYLDERITKLSSSTASGLDAVQLMTIHKAKGLESKIVVFALPYKREPNSKMWVNVPSKEQTELPVAFVNLQSQATDFDGDFRQERQMQEIDSLNVLYVALTRPEQKLIVVSEETKNAGYGSLLHSFVASDSLCNATSDACYTIGDDFAKPQTDTDDSSDVKGQMQIEGVSFPQWEKRVRIAAQNEALLSSLQSDSRRFGIAVHDLLAHIVTPDDLTTEVEAYCRLHHLSADDEQTISQRIQKMLQNEANRKYFDPAYQVKCEASIVVDGQVRRPDRIVFAPDQTWVVDFKTGSFTPESHRKYQAQVDEYAAALTAMGYPNVQPVIIYL